MKIELTQEMKNALSVINNTSNNVFITGKAGTGKTTFLKLLTEHTSKSYVITAPTGVAAVNAGGVTLHSLFCLPFGPISPDEKTDLNMHERKIEVLRSIDMLIIDEISIVRPDVIDAINKKFQKCRFNNLPFGGVQVIMFGDLFQLPPVIKHDDGIILSNFYSQLYFFGARVFNYGKGFKVIELSKIFRQKDECFVSILNRVRSYSISQDDFNILDDLRNRGYDKLNNNHIHICTHKKDVESINQQNLGKPTHSFEAITIGDFSTSSMPCDEVLSLRLGARVMILVNESNGSYCNGTLGTITKLSNDVITIQMDNGIEAKLPKHTWHNYKYELGKDKKIERTDKGQCTQFPITLAWAITIHKAQGLTFDNIIVDAGKSFAPGQVYVALSRCRSLDGITLVSSITKKSIKPNEALLKFEEEYKQKENVFGVI